MKGLSWMYALISRADGLTPMLYECPLCHCLVGSNIKDHTKYHEDRGGADTGE